MKKHIAVFIFLAVLVFICYYKLLFTFFQGDEWFYFTKYLPLVNKSMGLWQSLVNSITASEEISGGGHLTPLYSMIWFLHNRVFGINYIPYAISSLVLHTLNSYLIWLLLKKFKAKNAIAILSAVFFAVSFVHFQAVTWIMAYVPTQFSVFFLLLALNFLVMHYAGQNKRKNSLTLAAAIVFIIFALLTKESSVIIFILVPVLKLLYDNKKSIITIVYSGVGLAVYLCFRFLLPLILSPAKNTFESLKTIGLDLWIFRLLTYPLKIITEVFMPQPLITRFVEYITPLAYPSYGAEKAVRGTSFLNFTQTAGSDMVIYLISLLIIGFILWQIYFFKNITNKKLLFVGLAIILVSALPLLLISLYAPWWGYVTFIDSRHLYLGSIGASIIFSITIVNAGELIANKIGKKYKIIITILIVVSWSLINLRLQYSQLAKEIYTANLRKSIIEYIQKDLPNLPAKTAILVQSNMGYYGFGELPPFQTNLGQILSVYYYQNKQLPEAFLNADYFIKGLIAEGYQKNDVKGFGFYLNRNTFIKAVIDNKLSTNSIFAYAWDGYKNNISSISKQVRLEAENTRQALANKSNWNKITFNDNFSLLVPDESIIHKNPDEDLLVTDNYDITKSNNQINVKVHKKKFNIGLFEDISLMTDSENEIISDNFYYRDVKLLWGGSVTSKITATGQSVKYFIPVIIPDRIIELTLYGAAPVIHKEYDSIEEIISTIRYPEGSLLK